MPQACIRKQSGENFDLIRLCVYSMGLGVKVPAFSEESLHAPLQEVKEVYADFPHNCDS